VSLVDDLLKHFEHMVESVAVIPSDGGKFEVSVYGNLIYSKLQTHRHADVGEIVGLVSKIIEGA
jgi:selenoprotein W-related protein